ncbi:MAG: YggU family protein [Planctomycetes bacterium]|nr:YggU family protein [Planctomycetota bacterium]
MPAFRTVKDGVEIRVKVVPGASRSQLAGLLGDSLKVQIAAPPEKGRANKALIDLIAEVLGQTVATVKVTQGMTSPRKIVKVTGIGIDEVQRRLGMRSK